MVEAAAVVEATEAAEAAATVVVAAVDTAVVAAATVVVAVDTVTVTAVATRTEGPVRTTAKSLTDFFQETARINPGRFSF